MRRRIFFMLKRLRDGLYRPVTEQEDRRRLVIIFLVVALIISLVSLPLDANASYSQIYYAFVGLTFVSLLLAIRNQLWPGRVLVPLAGLAFVTRLVYGGGIHDDAIGGYYLLLIVVSLLFDQKTLILCGVISTAAILAIGAAETKGLIVTRFGPLTEPLTVVTTALFILATTLALHFLIVRLNQAIDHARRNELAQIQANEGLRELQANLERRVIQRTADLDFANQQLQVQIERINNLQAKLREEAVRDPLTGLFNRRHLNEMLPIEIARARRANIPITLLLADIDHFKDINDTHGHQAGDQVIQAVGNLLIKNIRAGDIVCRYGGEEFLLVFPGMKNGDAKLRAEKLRLIIESQAMLPEGVAIKVTVSIGGAVYPEDGELHEKLISAADQALYRAKQNGRNRVEFSQK